MRDHNGRDRPQPRDCLVCFVESPHEGITTRERTVGGRVRWTLMDGKLQLGDRGVELPIEQMRGADHRKMRAEPLARAEPQGGFHMLDGKFGIASPQMQ